ncbi:hypothetical protein BKD26_20795 [Streptomyces sp. CB03238]|nr:hypothetical protein BKD26_20795 [Streptomyces sp. CB03238]
MTGATAWARWAAVAGLLTPRQSSDLLVALAAAGHDEAERQLATPHRLRALLWPVLDALVDGEPAPPEQWDEFHRSLLLARQNAELPPAFPLRWQPAKGRLTDLGQALALQAEELLGGPSGSRNWARVTGWRRPSPRTRPAWSRRAPAERCAGQRASCSS